MVSWLGLQFLQFTYSSSRGSLPGQLGGSSPIAGIGSPTGPPPPSPRRRFSKYSKSLPPGEKVACRLPLALASSRSESHQHCLVRFLWKACSLSSRGIEAFQDSSLLCFVGSILLIESDVSEALSKLSLTYRDSGLEAAD